jgi:hypothetical protein
VPSGCTVVLVDRWETQAEVLGAAEAAGFTVSAAQLGRRQRAGLISSPAQRSRGPGGGRGTITVYPPGSGDRLVALCRRGRRHRSFADLAWSLWWDGCELASLDPIRDRLRAVAAGFDEERRRLVGPDGALTDAAEDALDDIGDARLNRTLRWSRRRVGAADFDLFVLALLKVFSGADGDLGDEDLRLLDRGLGLDRARTDRLAGQEPWLPGDIGEDLASFRDVFDRLGAAAVLDDSQLHRARDDARRFGEMFIKFGQVLRPTLGRFALGVAHLGASIEDDFAHPDGQATFLVMVAALVDAGHQAGLDRVLEAAPEVLELAEGYRKIVSLRTVVPAVADAISDRDMARALTDHGAAAELSERIRLLRQTHGAAIDAALATLAESEAVN